MKSVISIFDAKISAREITITSLFTVLVLVAGCAGNTNDMRAEIAPPPPVRMAAANGEFFGPAVPYEVAMARDFSAIEPVAGDDGIIAPTRHKCAGVKSLNSQPRLDVGFGTAWRNHGDSLGFNNSYFNNNSAGMILSLKMDLPGTGASSCR